MKKISKNVLFNIFLVSFLFGIFVNNILESFTLSFYILVIFLVFSLNIFIYLNYKKLKFFIYWVFLILWFLWGSFVSQIYISEYKNNIENLQIYDTSFQNNIKVEILDTYKIKDYNNEYVARLLEINSNKLDENLKILWIIKIAKNYKIKTWDIIESRAKFELIKDFNEFEYKKFMLSKWIYFKSYFPFVERVWEVKRNIILEKIDILREKSLEIIYKIYPKNEAIFLWGILLWARESLPVELKTNFNNSWLTHFIAVSGFNITILILFFWFLFKNFPWYIKLPLILIIILLFTFLVWFTSPVIRASLMWWLAYIILILWRKSDVFTILVFVAFLMAFYSPYILNYDVSFALSFLAVFGLVYAQDFWLKVFKFMPETLAIREAFVLTLSALTFTLPIMLLNFGQVSIMVPLANVAVTWTIPIAMLLWFVSIIMYLINPVLWYFVWYFDWIFLKWDMLVVNFFWTKDYSILQYDFGIYKNYIEIIYFILIIFIILYFGWNKVKQVDDINLIR